MESKDLFFTGKDVKRLFKRKKKFYVKFFLSSFFVALALYLFQAPRYKATAVFRQASQPKDQKELIRSFLQSSSLLPSEGSAKSIFESRTLLKEVVEFLGLQIQSPSQRFLPLKDSLFAEMGFKIPDRKLFHFSHVFSGVEEKASFFLIFLNDHTFEVLNRKKQKISLGRIGEPVQYENTSFVLEQISEKVKVGNLYPLELYPWTDTVKKMLANLEVKKSKADENVLQLTFVSPDATTSASALNCLMQFYQNYIKQENEDLSRVHKEYLGRRQKELLFEFEQSLEKHRDFLSESLAASGFMTLKQEVDLLEKPSEEYLNRLYDLDLQLSRLVSSKESKGQNERKKKGNQVSSLEKVYGSKELQCLEVDLQERKAARGETRSIQKLLAFLESKNSSEFKGQWPKDLSSTLIAGLEDLSKSLTVYRSLQSEKDPLLFLDIQQKKVVLKERVEEELGKKQGGQSFEELEGMSPETIQKLYIEYNQQLDSLRVYIEQLSDVKEQILLPHFEITSLSGLLTDSVSQEMILKASSRALELQDKLNHSAKDIERIQAALDVQKRFLLQHIEQVLLMQKMRVALIEEKTASLEKASIHQLVLEKKLVEEQLQALQERMKPLPEKWKRENELVMKKDLSLSMIAGLTQLAESKNVQHQLFQVESKPIDFAFVPYKSHKRSAFAFSLIIALFSSGVFFMKDLLKWLAKGNVLTEDFAKNLGMRVCGSMNGFDELQDLETIRKIAFFLGNSLPLNKGISASIISSGAFSLHRKVAELLAIRGLKVLVIECSTEPLNRDPIQGGLYEYLSKLEDLPCVLREGNFDLIKAGSYHGNFVEWLFRKEFQELVENSRRSYDLVLLSMRANPTDVSCDCLKKVSDLYVFHVCEEIVWEDVSDWMGSNSNSIALVFQEGI